MPGSAHAQKADLVIVKKSEARLYLAKAGKPFAKFTVVFGAKPKGHKQHEGDERTPEGRYILDFKKRAVASSRQFTFHIPMRKIERAPSSAG